MTDDPLDIPTGETIRIVLALDPALAAEQEYDPNFKWKSSLVLAAAEGSETGAAVNAELSFEAF